MYNMYKMIIVKETVAINFKESEGTWKELGEEKKEGKLHNWILIKIILKMK